MTEAIPSKKGKACLTEALEKAAEKRKAEEDQAFADKRAGEAARAAWCIPAQIYIFFGNWRTIVGRARKYRDKGYIFYCRRE